MTGIVAPSAAPPAPLPDRSGFGFRVSFFAGIFVTILLYIPMLWIALRSGFKL